MVGGDQRRVAGREALAMVSQGRAEKGKQWNRRKNGNSSVDK
jgi:hypothetical protein